MKLLVDKESAKLAKGLRLFTVYFMTNEKLPPICVVGNTFGEAKRKALLKYHFALEDDTAIDRVGVHEDFYGNAKWDVEFDREIVL